MADIAISPRHVSSSGLTAPDHPAAEVGGRNRAMVKDLSDSSPPTQTPPTRPLLAAQLLMLCDGATVAADVDSY